MPAYLTILTCIATEESSMVTISLILQQSSMTPAKKQILGPHHQERVQSKHRCPGTSEGINLPQLLLSQQGGFRTALTKTNSPSHFH